MLDMCTAKPSELIAVVDDDVDLGKALALLLRTEGYRVELFVSAEQFRRSVSFLDLRCVLVDIDLGSVSGLDMARELLASGFDCPIIFMTGSVDDALSTQCLSLGGVALLRKPFADNRLMQAIAKTAHQVRASSAEHVALSSQRPALSRQLRLTNPSSDT
jgi:FixJ family two-component response regulator